MAKPVSKLEQQRLESIKEYEQKLLLNKLQRQQKRQQQQLEWIKIYDQQNILKRQIFEKTQEYERKKKLTQEYKNMLLIKKNLVKGHIKLKISIHAPQTPTFSDEETEVDTNDETETDTETESDEEDTIFL